MRPDAISGLACGIGENPEDGKPVYRGATSILDLAFGFWRAA